MCEINVLLLGTVSVGIIGAIAAVGTAIVLNNGFCTAPASPAFMVAAGVASLAAVGALSMLPGNIYDYYECMESPAACAFELSQVTTAINALITVLSIQTAACFAAAGVAWIPWAGAVPMYAILATFIVQLALIPTFYVLLGDLASCASKEAAKPVVPVILGVATAVALVSIGLTAYVRRGVRWRWQPPISKRHA